MKLPFYPLSLFVEQSRTKDNLVLDEVPSLAWELGQGELGEAPLLDDVLNSAWEFGEGELNAPPELGKRELGEGEGARRRGSSMSSDGSALGSSASYGRRPGARQAPLLDDVLNSAWEFGEGELNAPPELGKRELGEGEGARRRGSSMSSDSSAGARQAPLLDDVLNSAWEFGEGELNAPPELGKRELGEGEGARRRGSSMSSDSSALGSSASYGRLTVF
ncbi:hypothetical protein Droror1_Dr00005592 [Drosera rotundifolia]